jgi:hypothetical protein
VIIDPPLRFFTVLNKQFFFLWLLFFPLVKAYDVGDRISIGQETFTVSKINLLSTYAYDSGK